MLAVAAFACSAQLVMAQTDLGSPYSIFGPGLPIQRQTITQAGMGGVGVAMFDPYRLNLVNPAAAANHTEPIFEVGGLGQLSNYQSADASVETGSFLLNNLSLAFPIIRGQWNLNTGIVPFSKLNYEFNTSGQLEDVGAYRAEYIGDGGISQGYIGSAYKLYQQKDTAGNVTALSVGGQFNFNFGPINNARRMSFPDASRILGVTSRESYLVRSPSWEVGVQYQTNIIKRSMSNPRYLKMIVGATYRLGTDLKAERSNYVYNWRLTAQNAESPRDTILSSSRVDGTVHMPSMLIAGVGFDYVGSQRQRVRFAVDYAIQEWSAYREDFGPSSREFSFDNSERISVGLEYTPRMASLKLLQRIEYRVGFRHQTTGINVADTEIKDYGISFGVSMPINFRMSLTQSRFHISTEVGTYGTTDNGLIQDDYVRIMAGFTFTPHFRNRWFVKPKYD